MKRSARGPRVAKPRAEDARRSSAMQTKALARITRAQHVGRVGGRVVVETPVAPDELLEESMPAVLFPPLFWG